MTDDEFWRGVIVAATIPIGSLLFQKAKAHLAAKQAETGRSLPERIGHRLGALWARGKQPR